MVFERMSGRGYRGAHHERGVALLIVLLLVTVMSSVAIAVTDDIRFAVRRTANIRISDQMSWYALGAEAMARQVLWRSWKVSSSRSTLRDPWAKDGVAFAIDGGSISGRITDGGTCFNLNSVAERGPTGLTIVRATGQEQYIALLTALEFDRRLSAALAASLVDWVDSDGESAAYGAEDEYYGARLVPYRTAGTLLAEPSELRAISGYTEEIYQRLRPLVCALPTNDLSRININTVRESQAALLVMLAGPELRLTEAQRLIAARPLDGFSSTDRFFSLDAFSGLAIDEPTRRQFVLKTHYFDVASTVQFHEAEFTMNSLVEVDDGGRLTTHARRYGTFD